VSEAITVTISDRLADIDQVMKVVYEGFVESGYIAPNTSGRRMIPHYLTPGAAFILASVDGQPAGALTCIPDGPWGSPSDGAFPTEFADLRRRGRIVEIGSLAVQRDFRSLTRSIAMSMMAVSVRYLNEADEDLWPVITVAPEQERFYSSVFSLERRGDVVALYGEPAVLMSAQTSQVVDGLRVGPSPTRRAMREFVLDPDPEWLTDLRYPVATIPGAVAA
jgi:hypothetical protein